MLSPIHNNRFTSLLALRHHRQNSQRLNESLVRLATGLRINRGADDPAGLIASEQLRATISALDAESKTLERTDQRATTADGALQEVSNLLNEAEGLVVANANDAGLSEAEKQANQIEIDSILSSVDRISRTTSFAGAKLLDGSATLTATNRSVAIHSIATADLGKSTIEGTTYTLADLKSGGSLETIGGDAERAQQVLAGARSQVSTLRGKIGGFQKHTVQSRLNSLDVTRANLAAAESQIRDLDYALEASRFARYELLRHTSAILLRPNPPRGGRLDLFG